MAMHDGNVSRFGVEDTVVRILHTFNRSRDWLGSITVTLGGKCTYTGILEYVRCAFCCTREDLEITIRGQGTSYRHGALLVKDLIGVGSLQHYILLIIDLRTSIFMAKFLRPWLSRI